MDSDTLALTCPQEQYTNIEKARLRKAIAKHDGWTGVEMRGADYETCVIGHHPKSQQLAYVPLYLTDPAETVRMLIALVMDGKVELRPTGDWGTCIIETAATHVGCDNVPLAVATAFHEMLLAKRDGQDG